MAVDTQEDTAPMDASLEKSVSHSFAKHIIMIMVINSIISLLCLLLDEGTPVDS